MQKQTLFECMQLCLLWWNNVMQHDIKCLLTLPKGLLWRLNKYTLRRSIPDEVTSFTDSCKCSYKRLMRGKRKRTVRPRNVFFTGAFNIARWMGLQILSAFYSQSQKKNKRKLSPVAAWCWSRAGCVSTLSSHAKGRGVCSLAQERARWLFTEPACRLLKWARVCFIV